jgi:hypothetical protein
MQLGQLVESYKFSDLVEHWARERLVHPVLVGRELAQGVIAEGLRLQSVDPKWVKSSEAFRGYPYIGYVSLDGHKPICIRATALEHLLAVMRQAADVDKALLAEEFVSRNEFRLWLVRTGRLLPAFWFGSEERMLEATASQSVK